MNAEFNNHLIVTEAIKRKLYYAFYELLNRVSLRFVSRTVVYKCLYYFVERFIFRVQ